jgi:hypothetical protein
MQAASATSCPASKFPQTRDDFQDSSAKLFDVLNLSLTIIALGNVTTSSDPAPGVDCGIRSLNSSQLGSALNFIPTSWRSTRRLTMDISAVEHLARCRESDEYRMGG